jgi:hypothetical protein
MKELEDMTAAETSLAFAREVVGLDPQEIRLTNGETVPSVGAGSDYANDWNATIAAVEAKGWTFNTYNTIAETYPSRDASVRTFSMRTFHGRGEFDEPCAIALCRAAIKCARAEVEK